MKHTRRLVLKLLGLAPVVPGLFREAVAYRPVAKYFLFNSGFLKGGTHFAGGWHVMIQMPRELMEDDLDSKRCIKWSKVAEPTDWDWDG